MLERRGGRHWAVAECRGAYLARVTVPAVVGLVVALCLPSVGQYAAGDPPGNRPGYSTGVSVRGVDGAR
ncbi:hypothetical protein [Streptomyces regalis]|uniref:hypothetical protein n=1 Tax=Streptomyces regalis TaxID=68262 RepID=UPI00131A8710|nr:hypothetical protein [Streptomyces regalis]